MSDRNRKVTTTLRVEKIDPQDGLLQEMTLVQAGLTNDEAMQAQTDFKAGVEAGVGRLAAGQGISIPSPIKAA